MGCILPQETRRGKQSYLSFAVDVAAALAGSLAEVCGRVDSAPSSWFGEAVSATLHLQQ